MKRMRRTVLTGFITIIAVMSLTAQLKPKHYWLAGSTVLIAGMIDGTVESMTWHYENGFKLRCPNVNDQFWNPAVSWKNKYKNQDPAQGPKFFGSTNLFVYTTDGYHMLRAISKTMNTFTLVFYINESRNEKQLSKKQKWLRIGADFLVLTAIRTTGFHLTYSLLFKKQ